MHVPSMDEGEKGGSVLKELEGVSGRIFFIRAKGGYVRRRAGWLLGGIPHLKGSAAEEH